MEGGRASIGHSHLRGIIFRLDHNTIHTWAGSQGILSASEDGFVFHGDQSCGPQELPTWPSFTCPTTLPPAKTYSSIRAYNLSSSHVSRRPRWHSLIWWTTSSVALSPSASPSPRRLALDGLALRLSLSPRILTPKRCMYNILIALARRQATRLDTRRISQVSIPVLTRGVQFPGP